MTRASRLQRASGLAEREFVEYVHAVRAAARARGNIRKADGDPALRNRMPYFFAVLEDLLARAGEEEPAEEAEGAPATGRGWTPEGAERYTSGPYGRLVQG